MNSCNGCRHTDTYVKHNHTNLYKIIIDRSFTFIYRLKLYNILQIYIALILDPLLSPPFQNGGIVVESFFSTTDSRQ